MRSPVDRRMPLAHALFGGPRSLRELSVRQRRLQPWRRCAVGRSHRLGWSGALVYRSSAELLARLRSVFHGVPLLVDRAHRTESGAPPPGAAGFCHPRRVDPPARLQFDFRAASARVGRHGLARDAGRPAAAGRRTFTRGSRRRSGHDRGHCREALWRAVGIFPWSVFPELRADASIPHVVQPRSRPLFLLAHGVAGRAGRHRVPARSEPARDDRSPRVHRSFRAPLELGGSRLVTGATALESRSSVCAVCGRTLRAYPPLDGVEGRTNRDSRGGSSRRTTRHVVFWLRLGCESRSRPHRPSARSANALRWRRGFLLVDG